MLPSLIDIHSHLQFQGFDEDREDVIKRSLDAGMWMIVPSSQQPTSEFAVQLAKEHKGKLFAAVAVHPTHAQEFGFAYDVFERLAKEPETVAIGECGIDYFRIQGDRTTDLAAQEEVFLQHIKLAKELDLPIITHIRDEKGKYDAYQRVLEIYKKERPKFVCHCFSGRWEEAGQFLELGGSISFTGNITYQKAEHMHEVIQKMPMERLMIETDAPYLASVPHRGERNEPLWVEFVGRKVAELRGIEYDEVRKQTIDNAIAFFKLPT
ncbi:MAG: TatD family hydrolase [Patescibacteria group bacterium]|jgi:TatD DNase family protein